MPGAPQFLRREEVEAAVARGREGGVLGGLGGLGGGGLGGEGGEDVEAALMELQVCMGMCVCVILCVDRLLDTTAALRLAAQPRPLLRVLARGS